MFFLPPKTILTIFFTKNSLIKGVFCCGATSAGSVARKPSWSEGHLVGDDVADDDDADTDKGADAGA